MTALGPKEHGRTNQLGDVAMDEPLAFGVSHGVSDLAVNVANRADGQTPVGPGLRRAKRASGTTGHGDPGGSLSAALGR